MIQTGIRRRLGFAPHPLPRAAVLWLLFTVSGGLFAALLSAPAGGAPLQAPGWQHWLGTDFLGRDFGWRWLSGGARTLWIATASAFLSVAIGGAWGIAAGFFGGWIDRVLARAMDVALAVPALVLAMVILAALGPGEIAVVIAVGMGGAATFARLVRAESVQVRRREFLLAARSLGEGRLPIILRHLLPNISGALAAYAALHFGWALVNAASLNFLGFGGTPSVPEWGRMLNESRLIFWQAPWQALATGLGLAMTVLAVQRFGEWYLDRNRASNHSIG
jgi:peptide/nickel transport system permease protein